MKYRFIKNHGRQFPIEKMCFLLKINSSSYYKWKKRSFSSKNDDTKSTENEYTLRLENDDYIIEINAKIGEQNVESDSVLANGTMTITRKSDKKNYSDKF
ncbi:hypothetical protein [Empedobacter falsenii]|uniref:hypothetical protein n=1 Tax=Empedobacter falsenii TaxID=343874 RepID=UPI001C8E619B|nr:hypothetical protein [Empedobacter falsenii]MBY0068217.1 hypothetical protein [Empedobacter falsenii]